MATSSHEYWERLDEDFADFQLVLHDDEADIVLAHGHSIPCAWYGTRAEDWEPNAWVRHRIR